MTACKPGFKCFSSGLIIYKKIISNKYALDALELASSALVNN